MSIFVPVRGKKFPSLVEEFGSAGYVLRIPVQAQVAYVEILPPRNLVTEETIFWPVKCFQLLLVASEYCAALHEFMTFTFPNDDFPNDWVPLKVQVAEHARQFIRASAAVPPSAVQEGCLTGWQQLNAHAVWAVFTHCYFHGLPRVAPDEDVSPDWMDASRWLHRLVGEQGWQRDGPVYCAADGWVKTMLVRLQQAFPGSAAAQWTRDSFGTERGLNVHRTPAVRGDMRKLADGGRFYPIYPMRLTGGYDRIQFKWKVQDKEAPRTIKGSCGVPHNFGQSDNCALGFLVLADVVESFCEAVKLTPALQGQLQRQKEVMDDFIKTVLKSDTADLIKEHQQYAYPSYLAACALGWELALEQVSLWLGAAAGSAAAAGLDPDAKRELLIPVEMALPGLENMFQQLRFRRQLGAAGEPHPGPSQVRYERQRQQQRVVQDQRQQVQPHLQPMQQQQRQQQPVQPPARPVQDGVAAEVADASGGAAVAGNLGGSPGSDERLDFPGPIWTLTSRSSTACGTASSSLNGGSAPESLTVAQQQLLQQQQQLLRLQPPPLQQQQQQQQLPPLQEQQLQRQQQGRSLLPPPLLQQQRPQQQLQQLPLQQLQQQRLKLPLQQIQLQQVQQQQRPQGIMHEHWSFAIPRGPPEVPACSASANLPTGPCAPRDVVRPEPAQQGPTAPMTSHAIRHPPQPSPADALLAPAQLLLPPALHDDAYRGPADRGTSNRHCLTPQADTRVGFTACPDRCSESGTRAVPRSLGLQTLGPAAEGPVAGMTGLANGSGGGAPPLGVAGSAGSGGVMHSGSQVSGVPGLFSGPVLAANVLPPPASSGLLLNLPQPLPADSPLTSRGRTVTTEMPGARLFPR